jgi:endonuclease V-like protein UPF0215 family
MYLQNPYRTEIRVIMVNSPTVGGFNVVNPFKVLEITQTPIILVSVKKPSITMVEIYRKIFPERREQIEWLQIFPPIEELKVNIVQDPNISGIIYFHAFGISKTEIIPLFTYLSHFSIEPEPLRLAHVIATAESTPNIMDHKDS